jgi:predicted deacylase
MMSALGGSPIQFDRIVGDLSGSMGPTVVFIGGMHGNEPSGVLAIRKVITDLNEKKVALKGRFIGLSGNLPALAANRRFLSKDLNRLWTNDFEQRLEAYFSRQLNQESGDQFVSEFQDQLEINEIIAPLVRDESEVLFIDLHTTSSKSAPFIGIKDNPDNREFAAKFPVTTVLGIDDYLEGPLLSYLSDRGHVALAFEAGQHDESESIQNHVSFIYFTLVTAGIISPESIPDFDLHQQQLAGDGESAGILEVIFRHAIAAEDKFKMNPGYRNFVPIKKGESLAEDRNGPIKAQQDGRIFMPLYQSTGEDGFFVVRERT